MLYQINYGPSLRDFTHASEYIHADTIDQAWVEARRRCLAREVVQEVLPCVQFESAFG
jgi:hypothetical protein